MKSLLVLFPSGVLGDVPIVHDVKPIAFLRKTESRKVSSKAHRRHKELAVQAMNRDDPGSDNETTFEVSNPDYYYHEIGQHQGNGDYTHGDLTASYGAPEVKNDMEQAVEEADKEEEAPTRLEQEIKNGKQQWAQKKEREEEAKLRTALETPSKKELAEKSRVSVVATPITQTANPVAVGNSVVKPTSPSNVVTLVNTAMTKQDPAAIAAPVGSGSENAGGGAAVSDQPKGPKPKGWDQCVKFARNIKSHGVTGVELVRTWKSTCEPSVLSGAATERYKLMCNSLGGAVQPFSTVPDYDVFALCDAVLTVFHSVLAQ